MSLLADIVLRPSKALDKIRAAGNALPNSVGIFLLCLAVNVAFQTLKPADFPPAGSDAVGFEVSGDWLFWTKVQLVNVPLTAIWIALAAWFCRLLGEGRLFWRAVAAGAALALPLGLILLEQQAALPRPAALAGWLLLALAMIPSLRKVPRELWLALASFFLCLDAVPLASAPLMALATLLRWELLYHAAEMLSLLWMLSLASYGLGKIARIRTARAFLAVILSALGQIIALYGMHRLGLVSKDVLKGLMSV